MLGKTSLCTFQCLENQLFWVSEASSESRPSMILNREVLPKCGPFLQFADCPTRLDIDEQRDWPEQSMYIENVFFDFADDLLDTYCRITQSFTFLDPYALTQITVPYRIMTFASELHLWAFQLARCPEYVFGNQLELYTGSNRFREGGAPSAAILQADLLETLQFLSARIQQIAVSKRCLVIVGI